MAVKSEIVVENIYGELYRWKIIMPNRVYYVASMDPYRSRKLARASAKRQAKRLGIDVSGK